MRRGIYYKAGRVDRKCYLLNSKISVPIREVIRYITIATYELWKNVCSVPCCAVKRLDIPAEWRDTARIHA